MRKTIYLVRHAEPNYNNHDDATRELTAKGLQDCQPLVNFFDQKPINTIISSPYKRAVDTIQPVADQKDLPIDLMADFRERKIDDVLIENLTPLSITLYNLFTGDTHDYTPL